MIRRHLHSRFGMPRPTNHLNLRSPQASGLVGLWLPAAGGDVLGGFTNAVNSPIATIQIPDLIGGCGSVVDTGGNNHPWVSQHVHGLIALRNNNPSTSYILRTTPSYDFFAHPPWSVRIMAYIDIAPPAASTALWASSNTPGAAFPQGTYAAYVLPKGGSSQIQFSCQSGGSGGGSTYVTLTYPHTFTLPAFLDMVFVNSGSGLSIYVDGALVASNSTSITPINTGTISLGGNSGVSAGFMEARVYQRGLSAAETWQLFDPATRWNLYESGVRSFQSISNLGSLLLAF